MAVAAPRAVTLEDIVASGVSGSAWSCHNGAIKYFRDLCMPPGTDIVELPMSAVADVREVVHEAKGQNYSFGGWTTWDWRSFVLTFSPADRQTLVGDGLARVCMWKRVGSYDHNMATARITHEWGEGSDEIVDIAFVQASGKTWLVHPAWKKRGAPKMVELLDHQAVPVPIVPEHGHGRSDGPGTYRRVTYAAYTQDAFAAVDRPAVAGPPAAVAAGPPPPPPPPVAAAEHAAARQDHHQQAAAAAANAGAAGSAPPPPPPPPPPLPPPPPGPGLAWVRWGCPVG